MTTKLDQAIALARKVKHVIISTVDADGIPHISAAGGISKEGDLIGVTSWYCPVSLINIQQDPKIAIVVWDLASDHGFQIIGKFENMKDVAIMDGYSPRHEKRTVYPQLERQLLIRVEKILHFSQALHADTEDL